jgi:opacity protein-like surface antigen
LAEYFIDENICWVTQKTLTYITYNHYSGSTIYGVSVMGHKNFSARVLVLGIGISISLASFASGGYAEGVSVYPEERVTLQTGEADYSIVPLNVQETPDYFGGWYAGIGGGAQFLKEDVKDSIEITAPQTLAVNSLDNSVNNTTYDIDLFAGFGDILGSSFYLGGELGARYARVDKNSDEIGSLVIPSQQNAASIASSVNVTSNFSYLGDLRLGYLFSPKFMLYVLVGAEYTKFDCKVQHLLTQDYSFSLAQNSFTVPSQQSSNSFNKGAFAFMPGLGFEAMITNKLSLRIQGTYANYGGFSHDSQADVNIANAGMQQAAPTVVASFSDKVNVSRWLATLDLTYHWNGI